MSQYHYNDILQNSVQHIPLTFRCLIYVLADITGLKKQEKKRSWVADGGKVVSAVSSFTASPKVNSSAHEGERESERERVRRAEFHIVQLLHSGSHYTVWKEDHHDDTEFIPHNASVIAVMEYISFTVAERINFRLDSIPAKPISHTWLFTWARIYAVWHLIKWSSSTY